MYAASVTCITIDDVAWLTGPYTYTDKLAVFRVALSDAAAFIPHLRPLLSPDEISRAARYHRADDQLRFSCTRGLLRILLGRYTDQPPERIEFVAGVNRKPALKGHLGPYFNVSHAYDWILIAIGNTPVGVDLDWINPAFSFRDLLPASFSPGEQRYIDTCQDARLCFFQLWTRKEALVKATANGINDAFAWIPSLTGTHPVDSRLIGQDGHWSVGSFAVVDEYPAAVAHRGDESLLETARFYALDLSLLTGFN